MTVSESGDMTSLGQRIVHGGAWLAALQLSEQLLGILRLIVVARLLAPSDLGLMGLALLTLSVAMALSETGIEQALIHRRDVDRRTLHWPGSSLS